MEFKEFMYVIFLIGICIGGIWFILLSTIDIGNKYNIPEYISMPVMCLTLSLWLGLWGWRVFNLIKKLVQ
jgi:hypothetical protein